jgi:hypothetical protein
MTHIVPLPAGCVNATHKNAPTVVATAEAPPSVNRSIHIVSPPGECVNPTPRNSSFLSRALPLAALGLEVFPVDARGKEPKALGFLNKRGKPGRLSRTTHATSDATLIAAKWGGPECADCNVEAFSRGANYGVDVDNLSECERVLGGPLDIGEERGSLKSAINILRALRSREQAALAGGK